MFPHSPTPLQSGIAPRGRPRQSWRAARSRSCSAPRRSAGRPAPRPPSPSALISRLPPPRPWPRTTATSDPPDRLSTLSVNDRRKSPVVIVGIPHVGARSLEAVSRGGFNGGHRSRNKVVVGAATLPQARTMCGPIYFPAGPFPLRSRRARLPAWGEPVGIHRVEVVAARLAGVQLAYQLRGDRRQHDAGRGVTRGHDDIGRRR